MPLPAYITFPEPAATTCWPILPAMSTPLFLPSSKVATTLPSDGQIQLSFSSSAPADGALAAGGAGGTGVGAAATSGLVSGLPLPPSGRCMSASAASEYGRLSPFGPLFFGTGAAGCGRFSTTGGATDDTCTPLPAALASGGSTRSTWSTLMSLGLARLFQVTRSR